MSTKSKAINVKIPTAKIIAALEQALNKLELDYTSQETLEAEYNKEYESWRQEMTKILMANAHQGTNVRINHRPWANTVNIDYDINTSEVILPVEPEKNGINSKKMFITTIRKITISQRCVMQKFSVKDLVFFKQLTLI